MNDTNTTGNGQTPLAAYTLVAVLCALLGFGAVYVIRQAPDNSNNDAAAVTRAAGTTGAASQPAPGAHPLAAGEMLTFVYARKPEPVPAFKFADESGAEKTLDAWKGKVVLLNLWASWCAPCRKEMPALDRLQKELGGNGFEVIALSVDRGGAPVSRKFLNETKVENLKLYTESTSRSVGTLRAAGLPTTLLIDREGREIGRLAGPAEWDSADAKRLIGDALK